MSETRHPDLDRDERRARWDARHAGADPIESDTPNDELISIVSSLRPGRALDLGCGDGVNAVWLARSGWTVTAVDFSVVGIGRGRERAALAGVEVEWVLADLLEFQPAPMAYDLVAVLFIHLPPGERRDILARAAVAVAPGGRLVVVGHDRTNLADGAGGPQDPDVLYTADEVAGDLPGLSIESAATVRRPGRTERGPIDAVVVAARPRDEGQPTS